MSKRTFLLVLLILTLSTVSLAQRSSRFPARQEALITALTTSKNLPGTFGDSGIWINAALEGDALPPEVRRILKLGPKAIPLLIEHIDDMRLTKMEFCCTSEGPGTYPVTVGDAAVDILTGIIREKGPVFDVKCIKDREEGREPAEMDCVTENYYLDMPSFEMRGKKRVPAKQTRKAKRNWQWAYRNKKLRYQKYDV